MKTIITLKKIAITGVGCLCLFSANASEYAAVTDTIILEFGNNSKILILIEDQEDLKLLQSYDINQMLEDLAVSIDSAGDDVDYLTIEDNEGDHYLRDTTIIVRHRNRNSVRNETRIRNGVSIRVANYEIASDNLEDLADDLDDLDPLDFSDYRKYERIEKRSWGTRHSFNLELGLSNWLEDGEFPDASNAQYTIKPWGSWYVGLSSTHKTSIGGPLFLEWGGHLSWYNWKFDDTNTRISKEDTQVVFSADNSVNGIKSKLSATYINAHLVPMFDFSYGSRQVKTMEKGSIRLTKYKRRGFRIGGGVYGGYRLGSRSKAVFKEDGDREKDKERNNYFMNNFRYGLRGQVGYKGFDFFLNYDLNEVFIDNRGPSLNAISFGIIL